MIIESTVSHYKTLFPNGVSGQRIDISNIQGVLDNKNHRTMTILDNMGLPVAIGGVIQMLPGVGEVWLYAKPEYREDHPIALAKAVKKFLSSFGDQFHRLQMTIDSRDKALLKWALFLGFKQEGVLRQYGQELEDHIMFSKIT
jgi:hypothetical protein